LLVTEVPVGSHRNGIWPGESKVWRIDAVRILDSCRTAGEIVPFSALGPEKFEARIKDRGVEVVEVGDPALELVCDRRGVRVWAQ
jgi:hypothetical protein